MWKIFEEDRCGQKKIKTFFAALLFQASFHFILFGTPGDIETWTGDQDTDVTNPNNWNNFTVPTAGAEGFFDNTASNFTPTLSATSISPTFNIDLVKIDTTLLSPGQYSFFIQDNTTWNFTNSFFSPSGVQVTDRARNINGTPVAPVQNFYINNGATVNWFKSSEADIGFTVAADFRMPPFIVYNLGNTGTPSLMNFNDSSRAGSAGYSIQNGSTLLFNYDSNAEIAQISANSNSLIHFTSNALAGGSIINATNASVLFDQGATAFFSFINLNNSTLSFNQGSNLFSATIIATNGSAITVQDDAICNGNASITMSDSTLAFKTIADGGHLNINASNSQITFQDSSALSGPSNIFLTNNTTMSFLDSSDAGLANITADNSSITFGNFNNVFTHPNSNRVALVLNNNAMVTFNNSATLYSLNVQDAGSVINFNNFLTTPMLFGPTAVINNGIVNINPFGPGASGPVSFTDVFNSYVSGTVYRGSLTGNTLNIVGTWTNNGEIIFNQTIVGPFLGTITGPGNVFIQGNGQVTLVAGTSSIQAPTIQISGLDTVLQGPPSAIQGNLNIVQNGNVDFEVIKGDTQTFSGLITGAGNQPNNEILSINKDAGQGTVIIGNPANNFIGRTIVYSGALQLNNGRGIANEINIRNNAGMIFNQMMDGTFIGELTGNGAGSKIGAAKLTFPTNSQNTLQSLAILQGQFELDGALTSPETTVASGATMSGTGTLTGNLEIFGTLAPGDPATFTIIGDLEFEPGSIYQVQISGDNNTLVDVKRPTAAVKEGNITLEAPVAEVTVVNGSFDPNRTYTILSAEGALKGQFASSTINDPLLRAIITYDAQHAYLQMSPTVMFLAQTFNQQQVAKQLNLGSRTNPEIASLIMLLAGLPSKQSQKALSQMSGEQYTQVFVSAQRVNQNFIRRLYDPLRPMVTSTACYANPCGGDQFNTWMDVSFDRSYYEGNKNCQGYRSSGYEISLGIQTTLNPCWTVGLAGFYENDHLHFNIGGSGKNNTGLGALYALYRPQKFYVLADLLAGYSNQHVRRPIDVLNMSLKGHPHIFQGSFYGEIGFDLDQYLRLGCLPWLNLFNIQPFFGLEADYFHLDRIREKQSSFLALHVKEKSESAASSRLGVHFTTKQMCCLSISVDMAWQCRLSSLNHRNRENSITFVDDFTINGIPLNRNSADGTINISMDVYRGWSIYAEAAGQKWENASSYNLLLGVLGVW